MIYFIQIDHVIRTRPVAGGVVCEIHAPVKAARAGEAEKGFAMVAGDTSFIWTDQDFAALIAAAFEQGLAAGWIPDRLQDPSPVRLKKSPP